MVHVLIIRSSHSGVYGKDIVYGQHQTIENNIANTKYPIKKVREGFMTPQASTWHFIEYRIKKELMPQFVADLSCHYILNPYLNNIKLKDIFTARRRKVDYLFPLIKWCFKWINKKKITCSILFVIMILLKSPFFLLMIILIYYNPIKPVPVADEQKNSFRTGWALDWCIGMLDDPSEKHGIKLEKTQEDVL